GEAVGSVTDVDTARHRAAPDDVEGDGGIYVGAQRGRVGEVEVVLDVEVVNVQLGISASRMDHDAVVRKGHGPEHVLGGEARVEVMGLSREVDKVKLTLKGVHSDLGKGAVVESSIHSSVDPLHEAEVRIEEERRCGTRRGVCRRPGALDLGDADEAVEIGDLVRLVAERWRSVGRPRQVLMDERAT